MRLSDTLVSDYDSLSFSPLTLIPPSNVNFPDVRINKDLNNSTRHGSSLFRFRSGGHVLHMRTRLQDIFRRLQGSIGCSESS